jgi:hypothetical protein
MKSAIALALLFSFTQVAYAADPIGQITEIQGTQASVRRGTDLLPVSMNQAILPEDAIVTPQGTSITAELKDGSVITVGPESEVKIRALKMPPEARYGAVEVPTGLAHFIINPVYSAKTPFYIRTPSATMGVRGTEFIVEQSSFKGTSLHTLSGSVALAKTWKELSTPSGVLVSKGHASSLSATGSGPEEPRVFNQKSYFENLSATHPVLMKQIEGQHKKFQSNHPELADAKPAASLKARAQTRKLRRSKAKQ